MQKCALIHTFALEIAPPKKLRYSFKTAVTSFLQKSGSAVAQYGSQLIKLLMMWNRTVLRILRRNHGWWIWCHERCLSYLFWQAAHLSWWYKLYTFAQNAFFFFCLFVFKGEQKTFRVPVLVSTIKTWMINMKFCCWSYDRFHHTVFKKSFEFKGYGFHMVRVGVSIKIIFSSLRCSRN